MTNTQIATAQPDAAQYFSLVNQSPRCIKEVSSI